MTEPLLTVKEASAWLRCDIRSLYRFIKRDHMPAYKLGSRWLFDRGEIQAWMKARASCDANGAQGPSSPSDPERSDTR